MKVLSLSLILLKCFFFQNHVFASSQIDHSIKNNLKKSVSDSSEIRIVLSQGGATLQSGEIYYSRPGIGDQLRVNEFGNYRDKDPNSSFIRFKDNTKRTIKPNEMFEFGDIIQTQNDGYVKILLPNEVVLNIGPLSAVQIKNTSLNDKSSDSILLIKMAYGRVQIVKPHFDVGVPLVQINTPNLIAGVKSGESFFWTVPSSDSESLSHVLVVHGQLSLDVVKNTNTGVVYHQPMSINPNHELIVKGVHGVAQKWEKRIYKQNELRERVSKLAPQTNVYATYVGAAPSIAQLPGTGVPIKMKASAGLSYSVLNKGSDFQDLKVKSVLSSFDQSQNPNIRHLVMPSENFIVPNDFYSYWIPSNDLLSLRPYVGFSPAALLPATITNVNVSIIGL